MDKHKYRNAYIRYKNKYKNLKKELVGGNINEISVSETTDNINEKYDYDLIIIGGGSGGMAMAEEASKYGKRVALFDYVKETPMGTSWGLGGTCVNVGCIPKTMLHHAAEIGNTLFKDANAFGWEVKTEEITHNWGKLMENIRNNIRSTNFIYKRDLREKKIEYFNYYVRFVDKNTIEGINKEGTKKKFTSEKFAICTGGRPLYPGIPGDKEHGITSDDLFWMEKEPGKTLIVGASYVAIGIACFLHYLGHDITVMVRSKILKNFDRQIVELMHNNMQNIGVNFIMDSQPTKMGETKSGKKKVYYKNSKTNKEENESFDTVLWAIGRKPTTEDLGLDKVGIKTNKEGKIIIKNETTNISNIFAFGDVATNEPNLTPVAAMAGKLLARRLYSKDKIQMEYDNIPTTIFTLLEYASVGLSEEKAIEKYKDDLEVYHTYFTPIEWNVSKHTDETCYMKVICNKKDDERILGIHLLGPNSSEIMQGFAVAVKMGATKKDLDRTVGIHPTIAEDFTTLHITKASGIEPRKEKCCS